MTDEYARRGSFDQFGKDRLQTAFRTAADAWLLSYRARAVRCRKIREGPYASLIAASVSFCSRNVYRAMAEGAVAWRAMNGDHAIELGMGIAVS